MSNIIAEKQPKVVAFLCFMYEVAKSPLLSFYLLSAVSCQHPSSSHHFSFLQREWVITKDFYTIFYNLSIK